jgi:ribonuclease HII
MSSAPTLRVERALLREGAPTLACVDEVGRGALAGPVSVGVVVLDLGVGSAPRGLRDSKLLTPRARRELLPRLRRWPLASAVGHADPFEVDAVGIICALRVAAARAFALLGVVPDLALLDGNHDWLSVPEEPDALFPDPRRTVGDNLADMSVLPARVQTRVRADLTCAGVAAASVLAKCERDAIMVDLAGQHPEYGWALNKGYSAPDHIEALRRLGPTALHRRSWNLPGTEGLDVAGELSTTSS